MEQRIDRLSGRMLRINEVTMVDPENGEAVEQRRQIAEFVIANGVFPTEDGELLSIQVCPESKKHQKLIMTGALPTIKQRGVEGVFPKSGKRRVVSFPVFEATSLARLPVTVTHELGPKRQYQFEIEDLRKGVRT